MFVVRCPFAGRVAKVSQLGVDLEKEYLQLFDIGNYSKIQQLYFHNHCGTSDETSLLFINEEPVNKHGLTWYCLKEIGVGSTGDWHWLTLDQLITSSAH